MLIGEFEKALLARYPRADAEEWDRMGLVVGDPAATITKVAVALDATVSNIKSTHELGASVLLTHHPVFIEAPSEFRPASSPAMCCGAAVYTAAQLGVALMNFHTALDVSKDAQSMLPGILGLNFLSVVEPLPHDVSKGYGQLCSIEGEAAVALDELASRCECAFGRKPRVWGASDALVKKVVTCTGSAASTGLAALRAGADALVCGELKYHQALDLSEAGLLLIELGHDVSENPFADVLARAASNVLESKELVTVLDVAPNWH